MSLETPEFQRRKLQNRGTFLTKEGSMVGRLASEISGELFGFFSGVCLSPTPCRQPLFETSPETGKNGPKMDFGLMGKIKKKSPENRKNRPKRGCFPVFVRFFLFWVIFVMVA